MGSLWTPGGEHPVEPDDWDDVAAEPTDEEMTARMQELQRQLAATPAEVVVANHGYGLFELAALHLGQHPAQLDQARLAIDALGALVEGLTGRLGEHEAALLDGLTQLRLAFVQVRAAAEQTAPPPA